MEIICVGNELLIGKTLNTNAHWLGKRATALGMLVKRITVVGDEIAEIAMATREALSRKPKFIITTGGLGPTFDDKTLQGVGKALDLELKVNEKALKMIRKRYETYVREGRIERVELTPARVKMAKLPEGAEPLPNSVGTAPGIKVEVDGTFLFVLPGVPPEMEAIFERSIAPLLKKVAGENTFFETSIYSQNIIESTLAPLIDQVMHDNPYVYIKSHVYTKSHPKELGKGIEINFSTTAKDSRTAKKRLGKSIAQLSELVQENGGKIKLRKEKR